MALQQLQSAKDDQALTWDALLALIPFLDDKADLSRLMRSCKTLHECMLSTITRQCHLESWEDVALFWEFVRGDLGRCALIRDLALPDPRMLENAELPGGREILHAAFSIVTKASNLRTVRLHGINVLSETLALYNFIAPFSRLNTVEFDEVGTRRITFLLCDMACPLQRAVLDFGHRIESDERFPEYDLLRRLARFQETLEELTLIDTPAESRLSQLGHPHVRFIRLHTLIIDIPRMDQSISMRDLAYVFPNLKTFTWRCAKDDSPEDVEQLHNRNINTTADLGARDTFDTLTSDAIWAYWLAFPYRARLWSGAVLGRHEAHLHYFRTVLGIVRPPHLDVALLVQHLRFDLGYPVHVHPSVEVTHLNVSFNNYMEDESFHNRQNLRGRRREVLRRFNEYMAQLQSSLRHMSTLQFVSLRFQFDLPTLEECSPFIGSGFAALDAGAYARALAEHLPELGHVFFQFHHFSGLDACWKITRNPLDVVKLSEDATYGVISVTPFAGKLCGRLVEERTKVDLRRMHVEW